MSRRIHYHYHRPGKGTTVFEEHVVLERPDVVVTLLPRYEGKVYLIDGVPILEPGAPIVWFLFPGAWYGVGRFHLADGAFTGWYTNLTAPVRMEGDRWDGTDLFLDHWLPPDGSAGTWLDEDELAEAIARELLTTAQQQALAHVRTLVTEACGHRTWPPPIAKALTLEQARAQI